MQEARVHRTVVRRQLRAARRRRWPARAPWIRRSRRGRSRSGTIGLTVTVSIGALLLLAAPSLAQYVSPGPSRLEIGLATIAQGESTTVAGRNCAPNGQVEVTTEGLILATTTADAAGIFSAQITIPLDLPAGGRTLLASCAAPDGSAVSLTAEIVVVEAAATPEVTSPVEETTGPTAPEPRQGVSPALVVGGTAFVAAIGAATIAIYRRLES